MKKIILGFSCAIILASCASSQTSSDPAMATSDTPSSASGADPLLAAESETTNSSKLATPVDTTASKDAAAIADAAPGSTKEENPFANLSDTPKKPEKATATEPKMNTSSSLADSAKSNTDAIPSNPTSSTSDSLLAAPSDHKEQGKSKALPLASQDSDSHKAAPLLPQIRKRKSVSELVDDYQQKSEEYERFQSEVEDRELIPHEGGNFQIGLDYAHDAFGGYDFDATGGKKYFDTQGAILSLTFFPIHSLNMGRLGLGFTTGGFLTRYVTTNTADANVEVNKKLGFLSFGGLVKYEFQYWLGQILVPHVFLGAEQVRASAYQLAAAGVNFPANTFSSKVYGGGLYLNLNRLEPKVAGSALANIGVRKFYLAYTYAQRSDVAESGSTHLLGLRFEY